VCMLHAWHSWELEKVIDVGKLGGGHQWEEYRRVVVDIVLVPDREDGTRMKRRNETRTSRQVLRR
jgi:hypothetical protein